MPPFLNVGESSDLDYLSDGITENIISSLSRLPRLRVMARSTSFRYKGGEPDVRKVGRELKVQTALVGRLREFKGRLLLWVALVDTRDGSQIWGESYHRPLSDLFRGQEEIAGELYGKLRAELTGDERTLLTKRHTESPEAHHLYLKGRYFWNRSSLSDIERSIKYFEESLGHDPDYALAHAGLADCYIRLGYLNELPFNDSIPAIRREAARAVALDETLAEAHCSLGYVEVLSLRWPEAEREFRRAIEFNPNSALARRHYAFLLVICGRGEEAVAELERALQLDPLTPRMRLNAAFDGLDEKVISLYARGMTQRKIQGHLGEIYGVEVSPSLISTVTDAVLDEVRTWQARPLDAVYPILYLDALQVKVKSQSRVVNKATYLAFGVNLQGLKGVLGMWAAEAEGAKFWMQVVTELKNRGVTDMFIACLDGLKGFPEATEAVFPQTQVQLCMAHLARHSLSYVSHKDRKAVADGLKEVYQAVTAEEAERQLIQFEEAWAASYPVIARSWRQNWSRVAPMFGYPAEIRRAVYTTNTIESLNMTLRKVTKNRSQFPNDEAVFKLLYLALRNISQRWTMPIRNWSGAMNQFAILFDGRVPMAGLGSNSLTQNL